MAVEAHLFERLGLNKKNYESNKISVYYSTNSWNKY